jgi:spore coat polysaccharide biosynthesis protein SpsF (cytidylyltransferase family)
MILAIIQARMSSERLPGKVMKETLGKPLIGYLLDRLKLSAMIDKIVLATSNLPENDGLCTYVSKSGVDVFRGSEDDVLDRFYQAATRYGATTIVRITGDCPLIDPAVCDLVINRFIKDGLDYIRTGSTFAEGLDCEVLSFQALKISWEEARLKSEREHVTLFVRNHNEMFKQLSLENSRDDSSYRVVVDEPEDFDVVKNIIEGLQKKGKNVLCFEDIKGFLDENPRIKGKNAHIIRNEGLLKSLQRDTS